MSSSAKYAKYESAVDNIISIIRRSYLGKKVDEEFLTNLKSLMENKIVATGILEQVIDPMKAVSVLNTELECLPLPNETLVKMMTIWTKFDPFKGFYFCHSNFKVQTTFVFPKTRNFP